MISQIIHLNVMDQIIVELMAFALVSNMIEYFATALTKVAYGTQMIVYKTQIAQNTPHQVLNIQP